MKYLHKLKMTSGTKAKNKKSEPIGSDFFGGGRWIRTIEVVDNRFTVCPLWPLGNSPTSIALLKGK